MGGNMPELDKAKAAWGGIGGSGKHSPDLLAEVMKDREGARALAELATQPQIDAMIKRMPEVAWGGIGGSGKHAADLEAEVVRPVGIVRPG